MINHDIIHENHDIVHDTHDAIKGHQGVIEYIHDITSKINDQRV